MLHSPFYDPHKSYEDNYDQGPFGAFAESDSAFTDGQIYPQSGEPQHDFLGHKVYLPFGIPAGPILNSNFVKAAFQKGFDIVVYKTVRAESFPCHPHPNVLPLKLEGDLTLEKAKSNQVTKADYTEPLSITNSFGVPSKPPSIWQDDIKKAISSAGKGQVLVLSFMGTVKKNQTQDEFVADFQQAAKLAHQTKAKVLEANLSCPNIGNEGLVCYNLEVTEAVSRAVRAVIGNTPLVLKIGYFQNDQELEKLAAIANKYAQAIASINTIAAPVVDEHGNQALPGSPMRLKSGICGTAIKWAGIDMVKRLKSIKEKHHYSFAIDGVGGVMNKSDYQDYINAGADAVMSATGAMWNPYLAQEIKS